MFFGKYNFICRSCIKTIVIWPAAGLSALAGTAAANSACAVQGARSVRPQTAGVIAGRCAGLPLQSLPGAPLMRRRESDFPKSDNDSDTFVLPLDESSRIGLSEVR